MKLFSWMLITTPQSAIFLQCPIVMMVTMNGGIRVNFKKNLYNILNTFWVRGDVTVKDLIALSLPEAKRSSHHSVIREDKCSLRSAHWTTDAHQTAPASPYQHSKCLDCCLSYRAKKSKHFNLRVVNLSIEIPFKFVIAFDILTS